MLFLPQNPTYEYESQRLPSGCCRRSYLRHEPALCPPALQGGDGSRFGIVFPLSFAIPLLGIMLKARGRDFKLHRREIVPLVLLGLLVALSSLSLFLSYNYMDAGIASTLLFVYPIFVALIMAFGFREKLSPQTALCILLALAGIGLLFKGSDGSTLNITGTVLVMVSALSYAIYIVGVNRPVLKFRCDAQGDILRPAFRVAALRCPAGFRHGSPCAR